jgi:hypothetical protein
MFLATRSFRLDRASWRAKPRSGRGVSFWRVGILGLRELGFWIAKRISVRVLAERGF